MTRADYDPRRNAWALYLRNADGDDEQMVMIDSGAGRFTDESLAELEVAMAHPGQTIDATWYRRQAWARDWAAFERRMADLVDGVRRWAAAEDLRSDTSVEAIEDRRAWQALQRSRRNAPRDALSAILRAVDDYRQQSRYGEAPTRLVVSSDVWTALRLYDRLPMYPNPGGPRIDTVLGIPVSPSSLLPPQTVVTMPDPDDMLVERWGRLGTYQVPTPGRIPRITDT